MDFYSEEINGFTSFLRRPPMGLSTRRFDEYYRCYPVVMMSGPDRDHANYGGKVFLPPSALDKLTRLHIAYPMVFELINGNEGKTAHAGVLEFVAEEGRIYLPQWLMRTLVLNPGDLLQVKSTDLPPGKYIKLQPQSPAFLDISDPRAVLENAFRNFACLSKGDIFSFSYNDQTYDIAVLEIQPDTDQHSIMTMETDLSVDFATPIGYKAPERTSGTSTPRSRTGVARGGPVHIQGTMAQSINYDSIAPSSNTAAAGANAISSNFLVGGQRLSARKGSKAATPNASTPVPGTSNNISIAVVSGRKTNGPLPLRLSPGKLFFGYEIKPVREKDHKEGPVADEETKLKFCGQGQTLRAKRKADIQNRDGGSEPSSDVEPKPEGKSKSGRTLR